MYITGLAAVDNNDDAQVVINHIINGYSVYLSSCSLALNQEKFQFMIIRSNARTIDIFWNGKKE